MAMNKALLAAAVLAQLATASPAPQGMDFGAILAAPTVASGPQPTDDDGVQTASIFTSFTVTAATTALSTASASATIEAIQHRDLTARDCASPSSIATSAYTPYYAALATSYTTDPALTATTTAGQACPTQPEAGTYCGFINPLDPCAPQPDGYGPVPTADTVADFLAFEPLHSAAQAAPTEVPSTNCSKYTQVFKDLDASVSGQSYLGLYSLQTYDVALCAAKCDAVGLCTAFNIFAERDPSLNPTDNDSSDFTVWGYSCAQPPSMTTYKCTLWGSSIDASMATNDGQWRENFHIVITGSDGYDKTEDVIPPIPTANVTSIAFPSTSSAAPTSTILSTSTSSSVASSVTSSATLSTSATSSFVTSSKKSSTSTTSSAAPTNTSKNPNPSQPWGKPTNCGGKAINAGQYWMGSRFFPGPFNPQVCSNFALAQNAANTKQGQKQQCQMFNAYYLQKNNVPYGTYCNLYNTHLDASFASYTGGKSGKDVFQTKQSWIYHLL